MIPFSSNTINPPRFASSTRSSSNHVIRGAVCPTRIPAILQQSRNTDMINLASTTTFRRPIATSSSSTRNSTTSSTSWSSAAAAVGGHQQLQQIHAAAGSSSSSVSASLLRALDNNNNNIRPKRTTTSLRQSFATRQTNQELDQIERLVVTLERLNLQVSRQLAHASGGRQQPVGEDRESQSLIQRATELNRRLRVLKHKLSLASDYYSTPDAMATYSSVNEMNLRNQQRDDLLRRSQLPNFGENINSSHSTLPNMRRQGQQEQEQAMISEHENFQIILQKLNDDIDPDDAPRDFVCPISQCVMIDPVRTSDGHCYDRSSIAEWFMTFDDHRMPTSPLTNLALESVELTPDDELRVKILSYLRNARKLKSMTSGGAGATLSSSGAGTGNKNKENDDDDDDGDEAEIGRMVNASPNKSLHSFSDEPSIRDLITRNKNVNISTHQANSESSNTTTTTTTSSAGWTSHMYDHYFSGHNQNNNNVASPLAPAPPRPRTPPNNSSLASETIAQSLAHSTPEQIRNLRLQYYSGSVRSSMMVQNEITISNENSNNVMPSPPRIHQQSSVSLATTSTVASTSNNRNAMLRPFASSSSSSSSLSVATRNVQAPPPPPSQNQNANNNSAATYPIWSSSVVPSNEPNARALNLIRMDETIEIPSLRNNNTSNNTRVAMRSSTPPTQILLGNENDDDGEIGARTFSFLPVSQLPGSTTSSNVAARIQNRKAAVMGLPRHSSYTNTITSNNTNPVGSGSGVKSLNNQQRRSASGRR